MQAREIFKNGEGELRAGWQIALFLGILSGTVSLAAAPLIISGVKDTFALEAATLVGILAATYLATRFINHKPFVAVGLAVNKYAMREFGIGCLVGWLMLTGVFGIEYVWGYVKVSAAEFSFIDAIRVSGISLFFFAVAAAAEELLFRGYMFQTLIRGIRLIPASILVGICFGFAHYNNPTANVWGISNTVLIAVLFAFAYWRTRSLWLPFGIHLSWNFSQTTLYGYPTSGLHFTKYELTRLTQFGPEWLTGGAYGPEGGAIATLIIVLCGMYIYFSSSLQPFPGVRTLDEGTEDLSGGFFDGRKAA
ncbi:MAG: type II CAAX endopeptidase family protein [bacterium]